MHPRIKQVGNYILTHLPPSGYTASWWARCLVFLWIFWIGLQHVFDKDFWSLFGPLNLGIHELGHLVFGLFGSEFLHFLGGTLLQCLVPLGSGVMFWKQKDFFAIGFAVCWLATNIFYIAWYIGSVGDDTYTLAMLPGATEAQHDWVYLLNTWGLLDFYAVISNLVFVCACLCLLLGLGFMGWILWILAHKKNEDTV